MPPWILMTIALAISMLPGCRKMFLTGKTSDKNIQQSETFYSFRPSYCMERQRYRISFHRSAPG